MTTPSTTGPAAGSQNDHDAEVLATQSDSESTAQRKPVRRRATRTTSAPAQPAAPIIIKVAPPAEPTTSAPAPSANVTAGTGAPIKPKRRRAAKPAGAAEQAPLFPAVAERPEPVAPPEPSVQEPAAGVPAVAPAGVPAVAPDADAEEPAVEQKPARRTRSRKVAEPEPTAEPEAEIPAAPARRRSTRKDPAPSGAAPDLAPSGRTTYADATGGESAEQLARPKVAPRLATTALLFQAPDPAAAQRPRRKAGPRNEPALGFYSDRLATREAEDEPAAEVAPAPAVEQDVVPEIAEATVPVAPAAPQFQVAELSADDAAAVDEVAVIEEELVAEGVELTELAPEDLDEVEYAEEEDDEARQARRRRRRGGRGRRGGRIRDSRHDDPEAEGEADEETESAQGDGYEGEADETADTAETAGDDDSDLGDDEAGSRRRRRRRRGSRAERAEAARGRGTSSDEVTALKGSTRLEAKKQRRREGRDAGRRRQIVTEAEFLARRESVSRSMVVREQDGRTQIAVLEDGVLVEHYVSQQSQVSMAGNVYLGRVQNVLPSMEAAFVDIGKGRNAVLYAGEVNWDAAGIADGQPRRIEEALKSGDTVLVQVTKDPIGHKGARLTSQVTLAGRYLVFVPGGGMTGISRKLPDVERNRLKKILREVVPEGAGVIVRTAAEGASEDELRGDVERLQKQWDAISSKAEKSKKSAPVLLQGEPDLAIRVVRDIFNDDFSSLVVQGEGAWNEISSYVEELAPDLRERVSKWVGQEMSSDVFQVHRIDEQLAKGMDRKVWLPSGGSLVIDRTEAMTVVDVNTGKFTGAGGTLEETVTRNNLEAAEEIVRQLRLRDIGGIIVIDFIDMVLESNRDLVLRRLVECLGRDRTKHQVAEVTSLGLVQMTRKRVGQGLVEAFSETCEHCNGRGFVVHDHPIERGGPAISEPSDAAGARKRRKRGGKAETGPAPKAAGTTTAAVLPEESSEEREEVKARLATIAAAAQHAHEEEEAHAVAGADDAGASAEPGPGEAEAAADAPGTTPEAAPKVAITLPEPRQTAAERPAVPASLDAIVLPDRSGGAPAGAPSDDDAAGPGDTDETGAPKGAGDEVA
ncbi:Rne/Rng family ribonuclease [Myceligenerans crystallogenes]|uniref:S1 motif domain-containing protein n=1 Tax=Myceligenerans crystallogenes TaxID=316335 RepID=A0ABP4ZU90_9MICO